MSKYKKEGMAFVRRELIRKNLSAPLGDHQYYGDEEPLPYKWINCDEKLLIFRHGEWLEAVSTDWDFDEREEPKEEVNGNSLRDNVKDAISAKLGDYNIDDCEEYPELMYDLADAVFDAMGVSEEDQDKINVKITTIPLPPIIRHEVEGIKNGRRMYEWVSSEKICHNCGTWLLMYQYGDWGYCRFCYKTWSMFYNRERSYYDTERGEEDQDKTDTKVIVNPKVLVNIVGGVAHIEEQTEGVDLKIRDYDVGDDPEMQFTDENGEKYYEAG
jgi:hypothetical protein